MTDWTLSILYLSKFHLDWYLLSPLLNEIPPQNRDFDQIFYFCGFFAPYADHRQSGPNMTQESRRIVYYCMTISFSSVHNAMYND